MSVIQLCDRKTCTGCSACYSICPKKAITMIADAEGFLVPQINEALCIECGLCQKCCPVLNFSVKESFPLAIYAGYINNQKIRRHSSSGGAFPAFAEYFYSQENGLVVAAAFDEHLNLKHIVSSGHDELHKFQGSKYVQSSIGGIFIEIAKLLKEGKSVLFVGTPCQVAGLKAYLRKDYHNLLTIDLVCHGVPSPKLFKHYLKQIGLSDNVEYKDFYFRNQKQSSFFSHTAIKQSGFSKHISPSQHSYICAYLKGWLHRESCYSCPFSQIPRQGDCTIADFWGILANKVPFGGDSTNGVSLIIINSNKGEAVFNQIKSSFYLEEKTLEEAKIDNHNLYTHDDRPEIRDIVYNELFNSSPESFMLKYNLKLPLPPTTYKRIISRLKSILKIK